MIAALAVALSAIVFAVAALHAYWGFGGIWPASNAEQLAKTVVGTPNIKAMPSPTSCFVVAALLAALACWPLLQVGLLPEPWPSRWTLLASPMVGAIFVGRGIAGYKLGWRDYFPEQPFAKLDRLVYSPLCLLLGAGYFALFFGSMP